MLFWYSLVTGDLDEGFNADSVDLGEGPPGHVPIRLNRKQSCHITLYTYSISKKISVNIHHTNGSLFLLRHLPLPYV